MKKSTRYSLHPGFAREQAYPDNLAARTGKSLEQWVALARKQKLATVRERIEWLKSRHALTTDHARWVAEECDGGTGALAYDPDALVASMFTKKAALVPLYEKLLDTGGFAKKDRITHRLEVTKPGDVDATVERWLKVAYERDA